MVEELSQQNFGAKVLDATTPIVIDFYAAWCLPCKPISTILDRLSGEYDGKVKFYRLDTDKNVELARKLRISDLPTVIFFEDGGGRIDIQRGTTTENSIRDKIEALLAN